MYIAWDWNWLLVAVTRIGMAMHDTELPMLLGRCKAFALLVISLPTHFTVVAHVRLGKSRVLVQSSYFVIFVGVYESS